MDIKEDLKNTIQLNFQDNASSFFIERVMGFIDESPADKDSLLSAADRVRKTVALFIDKSLAKEISEELQKIIKVKGLSNTHTNTHANMYSNTHLTN